MEAHTETRTYEGTPSRYGTARRKLTETKQAFKTTEFWVYVIAVLGVLIAGLVSDDETNFGPERVWLYVSLLTIGYMIARGIAKAGSHDPYADQPQSSDSGGLGDRVRTAAQILREGETDHHTQQHPSSGERY